MAPILIAGMSSADFRRRRLLRQPGRRQFNEDSDGA
jgi:hypothetical protein